MRVVSLRSINEPGLQMWPEMFWPGLDGEFSWEGDQGLYNGDIDTDIVIWQQTVWSEPKVC